MNRFILVIGLIFAVSGVRAEWEGNADLGVSFATGNTESLDTDLALDAIWTGERFTHEFDLTAYRSDIFADLGGPWLRAQNVVDADYAMRFRLRGSRWFGTVNSDAYYDLGLDWRFTGSVGGGLQLVDSERHTLIAEIGIGQTVQRAADTAFEFGETAWRWSLEGQWWLIPERLEFSAGVRGLHIGGHGEIYDGETVLRLVVLGPLTAGLRVDVHRETQPLPGRVPTDLLARLTVGLAF
ncbi:MAG: DUF481 domain-containing protein [Rhodospirillaceae bacterium]|nr:DUF481 domain-containing protein [Rhodospirillaceae bacterium]MDE0363739.1 DUF481 domain-containing protein [Rhodospirillaceae bacterium]